MARKKPVVGPDLTPDWLEKYFRITGELGKQLIRGLREPGQGLTLDDLQLVVEHRFRISSSIVEVIAAQQSFHHNFFGLTLDFSSVRIPERRPGFDRLIIVAQGLTPNRIYEACEKHFKCWRYTDDLDAALDWDQEERKPKDSPYAIWVRDTQEADEELKDLSAIQIKERGLSTETLTERLLHESMYWSETQKHLDTDNITYCTGSRHRDGDVPSVDWDRHDGGMRISWYDPQYANDFLRPRVVVS